MAQIPVLPAPFDLWGSPTVDIAADLEVGLGIIQFKFTVEAHFHNALSMRFLPKEIKQRKVEDSSATGPSYLSYYVYWHPQTTNDHLQVTMRNLLLPDATRLTTVTACYWLPSH